MSRDGYLVRPYCFRRDPQETSSSDFEIAVLTAHFGSESVLSAHSS